MFKYTLLKGKGHDHIHFVTCRRSVVSDLMNCSPLGSFVHEFLQARILEWVAIPFSRDLPHPGIEPGFPELQADSLPSEPPGKPNLVTWLCLNLCSLMDCSPTGSFVHGIL